MSEFTIYIELGNDSMSSAADVARALRGVAEAMDAGANTGGIGDGNGNTVGSYGPDEWPDPERDGMGRTPETDAFLAKLAESPDASGQGRSTAWGRAN